MPKQKGEEIERDKYAKLMLEKGRLVCRDTSITFFTASNTFTVWECKDDENNLVRYSHRFDDGPFEFGHTYKLEVFDFEGNIIKSFDDVRDIGLGRRGIDEWDGSHKRGSHLCGWRDNRVLLL